MISLNNISLSYGTQILYEHVNLTLHAKQKVGIIGANGAGKTSLFSLLLNENEPSEGDVQIKADMQIASVAQAIPEESLQLTAIEYVVQGDSELQKIEQALIQVEQSEDYEQLAQLHERMAQIDGYAARSRAAQLLDGLAFLQSEMTQTVASFSGGWQMRLNLARTLMCRSDLLLLDEPTNHLDLDAIIWLEKWLQQYKGVLLIISHDRDFLDKIIDHVVHIEHQTMKLYTGNYSSFEEQRSAQLMLQQATYEKQKKYIDHLQKYVDRFRYKASKAKQAQSRIKAIDRIERVAAVQMQSPFRFEFKEPDTNPYPLLSVDETTLGYDDNIVLDKINWRIGPGDRIALLGCNGAGKSTLIKALSNTLEPISGTITSSRGVKIGYFAQHQLENLRSDESALQHIQRLTKGKSTQELRSYLGGFGFSGDAALQSVGYFSGGEKSRLVLALLVSQKPNLLLLDEPTNHLDMQMREALSLALQGFTGAMVVVSHDRYLLRNTVDELFLVADNKVKPFEGDLDDYRQWLLKQKRDISDPQITKSTETTNKTKKRKQANPQRVARLEKEMQVLEKKLAEVSEQLCDQSLYEEKNIELREQLFTKQKELQEKLESIEQQWLELQ